MNDLLALKLAPNVTTSLLERISELHMSHSGLKTSLAELKYLETASKLPLYGLHQFHVKDGEETHIILSVYSGGIMVFEKGTLIKINHGCTVWSAGSAAGLRYRMNPEMAQKGCDSSPDTNPKTAHLFSPLN